MKRRIILLLMFLLSCSLLAFTEGAKEQQASPAKSSGAIELNTIAGPGHLQFILKRVREFAKETGIKVNVNVVPYGRDMKVKLIASFLAGGDRYDVFILDCVDVAQFAEAGWMLPIDKWVTPYMKKNIIPFAKEGMIYKGKWWGLPWASEWKSFVYNGKMLKDMGYSQFPAKWADVVTYSKKLQSAGVVKYATAFSWAQKECLICDYVALAAGFEGKFFDSNLNPLFNKGGSVEALQWMVDSIRKYKVVDPASIMWTEDNVNKAMEAGDIAFQMRWGTPLVPLNDPKRSKIVGQAVIGLMPSKDGKHPYTVSGPMGWAISKGTKHPEAAWKFINFMAGEKGSKIALLEEGIPTGWKSVINDPAVQATRPDLKAMAKQAEYIVNRPRVPWYQEFSVMFAEKLHEALTGTKTPQQALDDAAAKAIKIKKSF